MDYFSRIGVAPPREPTFAALAQIAAHHVRAIPFENLDVLLGRSPRLDLDSLRAKLVTSRRGGYCYEHATLCAAELEAVGFAVKRHSARVVMFTPRDKAPRTHMFLTAMDHVLDPGFGGLAPHAPVPLDGTPAGPHRIVREGDVIALYHQEQRLWVSSLEADIPVDFEMANHYTATWPQSPFVTNMMLRTFTPDGQIKAFNRELTIVRGSETTMREIADRTELQRLLVDGFGIDVDVSALRVPAIPAWD